MKIILLQSKKHGNQECLVDDEDYDFLNSFTWQVAVRNTKFYAQTTIERGKKKFHFYMHRLVMKVTDPNIHIDHKNGNGLDNQGYNLRTCRNKENMCNRVSKPYSTSKYLGVSWAKNEYRRLKMDGTIVVKQYGIWVAQIKINGKQTQIGRFKVEEDAARAYDARAKVIHGEFARLNFPDKAA